MPREERGRFIYGISEVAMKDPAHQVCPLEDMLFSTGKKVEIAQERLKLKRYDLLPTILEDLFHECQTILDDHCIKR